jgi:hypothetical protein
MSGKSRIDVYKILSDDYVIENSGQHLYLIGLSPINVINYDGEPISHKKYRYYIIIVYLVFIIKSAMIILSSDLRDSELFAILIGDFTFYAPSIRIHFAVMYLVFCLISLIPQFLFNVDESRQSWLRPFSMMHGSLTPAQVGITNERVVLKLLQR